MKILITAFDPFGGEARNASGEILAALTGRIGKADIVKLTVPTAFGRCFSPLRREIEALAPDAVVCLGQAGGRSALTPERVAVNVMDARIPDNDGAAPVDVPIAPDGPAAYFSTLPLSSMTAAAQAAGVPAQISNTAGTFVCNCLMYSMLHFMAQQASPVPCGFVHVPFLSGQGEPSLSPDDAVRGITAIMIIGWRNRSIIRLISLPNDRFGSE